MELDNATRQAVAGWVRAGESIAAVQQRLNEEFGIKLTFMETRFLLDELDLDLVDNTPTGGEAAEDPQAADGKAVDLEDAGMDAAAAAGKVTVDVDPVTRPGALVSGSVLFSDGKSCGWSLDQYGRLGLIPPEEGYQPSPEDIEAFQGALQEELRKKGF